MSTHGLDFSVRAQLAAWWKGLAEEKLLIHGSQEAESQGEAGKGDTSSQASPTGAHLFRASPTS